MAEKNGIQYREEALGILLAVLEEGKFSHIVINQRLSQLKGLEKRDRATISRICLGTIENCMALDYVIDQYAKIKTAKMKPLIRNLLRMSVYQIGYMEGMQDFAVCSEAVGLIRKRGLHGLTGFVNGVLRSIARNKASIGLLPAGLTGMQKLSIQYSMPEAVLEGWLSAYGYDRTEDMLKAFQKEKRLSVRVNQSRISKADLLLILQKEGLEITESELLEDILYLNHLDSFEKLDSFQRGLYQVQDGSSALAVRAAGIQASDYILDVCAAPGGKAVHAADCLRIAEAAAGGKPEGLVSARDIQKGKVERMAADFKRCGFTNIEALQMDALQFAGRDQGRADVVLADLPCSGLGIIGKKPDIKYKMTKEKQKELVSLQRDILRTISPYVKTGGTLVYSTCTVHQDENENNYQFIIEELGFSADSLDPYIPEKLQSNTTKQGYLQILPGTFSLDGFFISRFKRKR